MAKAVELGGAAVEPLLDCLENNNHFSRSFVTAGIRWQTPEYVLSSLLIDFQLTQNHPRPVPVRQLALFALLRIFNLEEYNSTTSVYYQSHTPEAARESAARLRVIWIEQSQCVLILLFCGFST